MENGIPREEAYRRIARFGQTHRLEAENFVVGLQEFRVLPQSTKPDMTAYRKL